MHRVEPAYPEWARKARLEGTLILQAVIDTSGSVQELRVLKSAHPALDAAAEDAVRQWRYRPATLNGRVVSVYLTVTVQFRLRQPDRLRASRRRAAPARRAHRRS
ncbi:MAG: energy transducer TonB [Thermoanaerobaculia bacterium]